MSTVSKGKIAEKRGKTLLENMGYVVDEAYAVRAKRGPFWFTNQHDRFGVYDLVAIHRKTGDVRLVQVTDGGGASAKRKKIDEAGPWPVGKSWIMIEVWELFRTRDRLDHKRIVFYFRVHRLELDGWKVRATMEVPE